MSGTKRTPIARQANLQVTPHALALFAATEKASRQRRAASCVANLYGYCSMECGACQDWANAHSELHKELGLRPWEWPCLPVCPHPPGSSAAQDWSPSGPELQFWQTLERARRAAMAVSAGA
jgi:hypothetical protein